MMHLTVDTAEIKELKQLLKSKKIYISSKDICGKLQKIEYSQEIFPQLFQKALVIQLLHVYEKSKKKEVIILEELGERKNYPITIVLGALATDWPGMSNSILGIIHQKEGNVLFMKGITVPYKQDIVGIVILSFLIDNQQDYNQFLLEKRNLTKLIRDASKGSLSKTCLLDDETVKFEIYNQIVHTIQKNYRDKDIENLVGKDGEALKFISSRSREYLEERNTTDLASLIINNYRSQCLIREGKTDKVIKIKNFQTKFESLTGITFVCLEIDFSIEDFLKTLEFFVPGHIIKHHKSFVTSDGILIYRIEIVDQDQKPLNPDVIRSIEGSIARMITTAHNEKFFKIKSIGGFEHYGRAIIPFLMEELIATNYTQVFLNVEKKTEFMLNIKLIIVSFKDPKKHINQLIQKMEKIRGVAIYSFIPPKIYKNQIQVGILNLRVDISEFSSIIDIFMSLRETLKKFFGNIRDFDEGLRVRDLKVLNELIDELKSVNPLYIKELYYNLDELYRLEAPFPVLKEIIRLSYETVESTREVNKEKIVIKHKHLKDSVRNSFTKTILVVSHLMDIKILEKVLRIFVNVDLTFTKIEWNQRLNLIMVLKREKASLQDKDIESLKKSLQPLKKRHQNPKLK